MTTDSAGPRTLTSRTVTRRTLTLGSASLGAAALVASLATTPALSGAAAEPADLAAAELSPYDLAVLDDAPTGYWAMSEAATGVEPDLAGGTLAGGYTGEPGSTTLPNGEAAAVFDGLADYLEVPDDPALSPATTGVLTVQAWFRPDTVDFPRTEAGGYIHWLGKGEPGEHEYVARMYSQGNDEDRENRISGYLFNLEGGLGAGSYFQDPIVPGDWIHYVLVINADATSPEFPNGYTKIYRDGVLRDQDDLSIRGTVIVPERGSAPFRVGTRDGASFLLGAVGKVAVYDHELAPDRIVAHHETMLDS